MNINEARGCYAIISRKLRWWMTCENRRNSICAHAGVRESRIWSVQFGKTPRYGLRYLPTMTPTEGRPDQEKRYGVLQSYARCIL